MSEIKVNSIKGVAASSAALSIHNSDGSVTIPTPDIPDKPNYNLIINGQFDIWQRGTDSGSNTTDGILGADRWFLASSGATKQVTRQAFATGQTDVPSNPQYYLRFAVTTGNNNCALRQRIEGVDRVQGAVTLSFWAKGTNPAGGSFDIINRQNFGTGGSPSNVVDTGIGNFTVTSSWAKKTFTFTPASISGKTLGTNNNSYFELEVFRQPAGDTGTAAYTIDIANVKLEYGSYATDYQRINVGQELALCQRYFYMHASGAEASANNRAPIATGAMYNSGNWNGVINFPVKMRTSPSLYKVQGTDYFIIFGDGGNDACNSAFLDSASPQAGTVNLYSGLAQTSGTSHWGLTNNSATRLGFQAEL